MFFSWFLKKKKKIVLELGIKHGLKGDQNKTQQNIEVLLGVCPCMATR